MKGKDKTHGIAGTLSNFSFRSDVMEIELRVLKLSSKAPAKNKLYESKS